MIRFRLLVVLTIFLGLLVMAAGWWDLGGVYAQTEPPEHPLETPEMEMPPLPQGLDPPPTVFPPTEVYKGSYTYYMVCMACHGDQGQGLTDEWRGALDPPDQNCWQSKCHHANHPVGGFVFPKFVPAVKGPIMAARFETGLALYQYIKGEMPFQAPGSLSDEEYWQLTAFLLSLNGVDPGNAPLNAARAGLIYLREPLPLATPMTEPPRQDASSAALSSGGVVFLIFLILGALVVVFIWVVKPFRRQENL